MGFAGPTGNRAATFDELHGKVRASAAIAWNMKRSCRDHARNVRMVESREKRRLFAEARQRRRPRQRAMKHLDGDLSRGHLLVCFEDGAHSANANHSAQRESIDREPDARLSVEACTAQGVRGVQRSDGLRVQIVKVQQRPHFSAHPRVGGTGVDRRLARLRGKFAHRIEQVLNRSLKGCRRRLVGLVVRLHRCSCVIQIQRSHGVARHGQNSIVY